MKIKIKNAGFTLIELLLVIGILGVLAVTLLVALNPIEAQRKARDSQRQKDLVTLQSVLEQALEDGVTPCTTYCRSTAVVTASKQGCDAAANWTGVDLCSYVQTVPSDPLNKVGQCVNNAGVRQNNCGVYYALITDASGNYEINVRQESTSNASKLSEDNGNNAFMIEVYNNLNTMLGATIILP